MPQGSNRDCVGGRMGPKAVQGSQMYYLSYTAYTAPLGHIRRSPEPPKNVIWIWSGPGVLFTHFDPWLSEPPYLSTPVFHNLWEFEEPLQIKLHKFPLFWRIIQILTLNFIYWRSTSDPWSSGWKPLFYPNTSCVLFTQPLPSSHSSSLL